MNPTNSNITLAHAHPHSHTHTLTHSHTHTLTPHVCTRLQLLNSTVQQLATSVNQVLTACYSALYGDEDGYDSEPARLELRTSPLAANEEVIGLYGAGILPCEVAVPAALHALGVGPEEIDRAVEEVCKKKEQEEKLMDEDRKKADEESKLNKREREVGMEATKANTEITKKEASGMVKKSEASASSSSSSSSS